MTDTPETPETRQFDFDELARDFIQKVATCPSMLNVATVAGWFRSAVQFHALHCDPPSSPREPQKDETPRCEGRYPVGHQRSEPFDVTYRCALPAGHDGPHGDRSEPIESKVVYRPQPIGEPHAALIAEKVAPYVVHIKPCPLAGFTLAHAATYRLRGNEVDDCRCGLDGLLALKGE